MADDATAAPRTSTRKLAGAEPPCGGKPYHHGDLSRGLVEAGRRILEAEGPDALSLRAVAREAGVSPAAPYHHFKDKGELLDAIAAEGWHELGEALAKGRAKAPDARSALTEIGVFYVCFARDNPADPGDAQEMQLIQIAAWCSAHGVAEMVGFKEFDSLKQALGGEEAFIRAVLGHVGILSHKARGE
jgi:AcrR family transcriptional regulator